MPKQNYIEMFLKRNSTPTTNAEDHPWKKAFSEKKAKSDRISKAKLRDIKQYQ